MKIQLKQLENQYKYEKAQLEQLIRKIKEESGLKNIYAPMDGYYESSKEHKKGTVLHHDTYMYQIGSNKQIDMCWVLGKADMTKASADKNTLQDFKSTCFGTSVEFYIGKKKVTGRVVQDWYQAMQYIDFPQEESELPLQLIRVNNELDNSLGHMRAYAIKAAIKNQIIISKEFVQKEENKRFVWVKNGEQIERRYITVGFTEGKKTWVLEGLSEGETIVTDTEV